MFIKSIMRSGLMASVLVVLFAGSAYAGCVSKSATATSGTQSSAKWFAMETMVQGVSWGLWPGWLATGEVAGYKVTKERYKCKPSGGSVTCISWATFCTK